MTESRKGVRIPFSFVPFPREIWKENLDISLGEFRVLGYLLSRLYFGQSQRPISDEELLNGELKEDGTRRDKGCGLTSRNGLKIARESLISRGWIEAVNVSTDPHRTQWEYTVRLFGDDDNSSVTPRHPLSQNDNAVSQNDNQTPVPLSQNDTLNLKEEEVIQEVEDNIATPSLNGFSLTPESNGKPKKHTRVLEKTCDPRCKAVTAKIFEAYKHFNQVNPPWGQIEGNLLKLFLLSHSDWNEEKIFECIRNRFKSEENLALEPRRWMSRIGDYAGGPLDKFGKPKTNGNGFHNGQQSHTNGPGSTTRLLDHLPGPEETKRRREADDKRLAERRNARGI